MTDNNIPNLPVDAGLFDLFPGEELVEKVVGVRSKHQLEELIQAHA